MIKILAFSLLALTGTPREEARIKALFIQTFMRNMEWPTSKDEKTYKIGVIGDIYMVEQIKSLTNNRLINRKAVEVFNYTSDVKLEDLNILFISKNLSDMYPDFHKVAVPNSVLVVTEEKGLGEKGAAINFVVKGSKMSFEYNEETLNASDIKASHVITKSGEAVK